MKKTETSKIFMSLFSLSCIVWITICIKLEYLELAQDLIRTTLAALICYFGQARFGKYCEEKNRVYEEEAAMKLFERYMEEK
ncbi:MAG: hypothetical protein FWE14_04860 [Lachnospiraceae bacterium]|nr:hypothetical protein [Lachnospiraceae bacterium]